ncbi:MAG: elongation factor P hydroxylase [Deltaproteobacteria bacterium]|nr:elongation factor P hydroxylase [Deltaproteobacteria bacterium]
MNAGAGRDVDVKAPTGTRTRSGGGARSLGAADLERIFRDCFFEPYATVLEGGSPEPLYLPSAEPEHLPHRILYREDYFASALHEIAHWCLAGPERRLQEDYGYWYRPDGRSAEEQAEFERAEARPQALEWIFSDACRFDFHLSADNLAGALGPSDRFEAAVRLARAAYLAEGLPERAERFRAALARAVS